MNNNKEDKKVDEKEILELIKSNVKLAENMKSIQKDLARLVDLIEKDVKNDLEDLENRVVAIEKDKSKLSGIYVTIAIVGSAVFSVLMRYLPFIISK